ncbi:MAG: TMEM175 family protein [Devosia sp.]
MKGNENERLIMFSDAVIAITITLLVLDIRLPTSASELTESQLWSELLALGPRYLSYVVSFVVIGIFWMGHRQKFETITRSSPGLIWLNLLFLLGVGIMPFVTDILAESNGSLSTMLYAALVAVISLVSALMAAYARWTGLIDKSAQAPGLWRAVWPSLAPAVVFAVSIPIAYLDSSLGKYFWLTLIPLNIAIHRLAPAKPD